MRIAIAGVPRSGKTYLSNSIKVSEHSLIFSTDDLIESCEWSELSQKVSEWFNTRGDFIIEGVAVPRALRKWLAAHPEGKPCDQVIWMGKPREVLEGGKLSMAKGCLKVMDEIEFELKARGVEIIQK